MIIQLCLFCNFELGIFSCGLGKKIPFSIGKITQYWLLNKPKKSLLYMIDIYINTNYDKTKSNNVLIMFSVL